MIKPTPNSIAERGATLGQLIHHTHSIQVAVVDSLVSQGHRHMLDNTRGLEQSLFRPVSQVPGSAAQEKGHQLQAWMHISRLDDALETFDHESRGLFASQPDASTSLHTINQRNEQLSARVEARHALLERRTAWAAATPPPSSEMDPITVPVLPPAPLSYRLNTPGLEQAVKHINALEKQLSLLDTHIKQLPQPISHAEEDIFIRQRNSLTEYRNAWATGRLQGSSQLKTTLGLVPERKRLEQDLERYKQLAPLELTLHRLERMLETIQHNKLGDKLSPQTVSAAREALVDLRDAWYSGSLDGSSAEGMNPVLVLTPSNKRRVKLELAVIEKGFVQMNATPRAEQPGSTQDQQDFKALIHSATSAQIKMGAINQFKESNKQRALVAELNTDLRTIYNDLKNNLALHHITTSHK